MSFGKRTEFILLLIFTVLLTIGATLPTTLLSFVCTAAISALIGFVATRYHYGYVACLSLISVAVLFFFVKDILAAIYTALPVILCGLTLGICKNLLLSPLKAIFSMSIIEILSITATLKLVNTSANGKGLLDELLFATGDVYKEALMSSYGTSVSEAEINAIITETISMIKALMPSVMILISILSALLCYYLFKRICMLKKDDVSMLTPFCEWRAERGIAIMFFVILALQSFLPQDTMYGAAFMNVSVVMIFVFSLLGLAFLEHILKKRVQKSSVRKLILIGIFIVSLLMFIPFLVLGVFGAIDAVWDFRTRLKAR